MRIEEVRFHLFLNDRTLPLFFGRGQKAKGRDLRRGQASPLPTSPGGGGEIQPLANYSTS